MKQFLKVNDTDWSNADQLEADQLLALWIGGSVLPVSITENEDMKAFVNKINPKVIVVLRWKYFLKNWLKIKENPLVFCVLF